jgi:proteasome lid subunit RPN8/RPN11
MSPLEHALAEYPKEACGLLIVTGEYVPVENIAYDPYSDFQMPGASWIEHGEVITVYHSHCAPQHGAEPSDNDRRRQRVSGVPWCVLYTDGKVLVKETWMQP